MTTDMLRTPLSLHRPFAPKEYDALQSKVAAAKTYVVEAELIRKDPVPLYDRADLAVTHEDSLRQAGKLTVVVHNIGCKKTGGFTVKVVDAASPPETMATTTAVMTADRNACIAARFHFTAALLSSVRRRDCLGSFIAS
jgi:hypothetical protein